MSERHTAEYQDAVAALEESYKAGVRAFAEWFAKEWTLTPEQWAKAYADPPPGGPDWFKGHNAGVESVLLALDSFFGDFHP
jgi:hypothetical protein